MTEAYAIVPVREFRNTKLRLSQVLSESERAGLTRVLLRHVVLALQGSKKITETIVVSSNAMETKNALNQFENVRVIQESKFHGGVNSAVNDGIKLATKLGERDPIILILPSDLALLTGDAIVRAIRFLDDHDLLINPSLKKDGTNLLAFHLSKRIPLYYDQNSYANHIREARSAGIDFLSTEWKEFSFDVDDPEDLKQLMQEFKIETVDFLIEMLQDQIPKTG